MPELSPAQGLGAPRASTRTQSPRDLCPDSAPQGFCRRPRPHGCVAPRSGGPRRARVSCTLSLPRRRVHVCRPPSPRRARTRCILLSGVGRKVPGVQRAEGAGEEEKAGAVSWAGRHLLGKPPPEGHQQDGLPGQGDGASSASTGSTRGSASETRRPFRQQTPPRGGGARWKDRVRGDSGEAWGRPRPGRK